MVRNMAEAVQRKKFSYFQIITGMLSRPGTFFGSSLSDRDVKTPVIFLLISTLFYSLASLTVVKGNIIVSAGILVLNAITMPFITAAVSAVFIRLFTIDRISFLRIFAIHAFAGGTVLLAAWIPLIMWITEPWKWILIISGYVKGCGMTYLQAIIVSVITAVLIISGFQLILNNIT